MILKQRIFLNLPKGKRSITRELDSEELLERLPALQQLLYRLMGCRPERAAVSNYVIQYALALAGGLDCMTKEHIELPSSQYMEHQPPTHLKHQIHMHFQTIYIAAPPSTQMASVVQYQANPFGPYQQQPHMMMGPQNPFVDMGFGAFPDNNGAHQQTSNPFGSTGLL